jgi:hypothetical protein
VARRATVGSFAAPEDPIGFAAHFERGDINDAVIALRLVLQLGRVLCLPQM